MAGSVILEMEFMEEGDSVEAVEESIVRLQEGDLIHKLRKMKEEVEKLQEELLELKVTKSIGKDEDPTLAISQSKEIQLLAELKVLKQKKPSEIDACYSLLIEVVKKHLNEQEESLKQTLEAIESETETLKSEEQKYEQRVKEENHLIAILEKELVERESQPVENGRKMERLQEKLCKARKLRNKRMKETRVFLQQYYPLPERKTLLKYMNNKKSIDENSELNIMSLGEMLELLLNATLKKPYDPWITIDDHMWPPYIELLLRYNIIVRHPVECRLIKLETELL